MECSTAFKAWRDKSATRVLKIRRVARPQLSRTLSETASFFFFLFYTRVFATYTQRFFAAINSDVYFRYEINTTVGITIYR